MTQKEGAWRRRGRAVILLTVAAALLLAGAGNRIVDGFGALSNPNTLAAVSLAVSGVPSGALPVTLLDIDDRTRDAWEARTRIPHAALASLIAIASTRGAAAIILDVDLAGEAADEPPDPALFGVLANYPSDGPALMLARRIVFAAGADDRMMARASVATAYDNAVGGKPNIHWITTLNDVGKDRAVRRIRLWQSICGGSEPAAFPSALLVTAAQFVPPRSEAFALDRFLDARARADCEAESMPPAAPWPGASAPAATIPYLIPDRANARALFRVTRNGREMSVLRRIPAAQLALVDRKGARPAGDIDSEPFRDRLVLIGASDAASGDIYNTPLGTMPGALIIANGVVQTERIMSATAMPGWARGSLIIAAFLGFVFLTRRFQGLVAGLLISAIAFGLLCVIARMFNLADGVAVIAASITGLALFKLLESLAGLASGIRTHGWRAVLKK